MGTSVVQRGEISMAPTGFGGNDAITLGVSLPKGGVQSSDPKHPCNGLEKELTAAAACLFS